LLFSIKNKMKSIILLFVFSFSFLNYSIDKGSYYNALKSKSVTDLDKMILLIEKEKITPLNQAYKGTLVAKKAGFEKKAAAKIKLFKAGVVLLEAEISKSPKNVEYRFLRLTIQENAPKILKYNKNIKEDIAIITKGYSTLKTGLKKIIIDYSNNSTVLNSSDLK